MRCNNAITVHIDTTLHALNTIEFVRAYSIHGVMTTLTYGE